MKHLFSNLGERYEGSPIDLKMKGLNEDVRPIYLSIGEPHPQNIPTEKLRLAANQLLSKSPTYLKYGGSDGDETLREYILSTYHKEMNHVNMENIVITSGSTQGMDMICKLFINKGDVCIVETPTYSNSFNTMRNYGADLLEIQIDEDGLNPDVVEEQLKRMKKEGRRVKLLCLIPNAQNPSGVTLTHERRIRFYELAHEYDFMIIEDDPYSNLTFSTHKELPILTHDSRLERVVYLNSFSKILAPGLRVAWMIAHKDIAHKVSMMKQSVDCCSNPFTQAIVSQFCQNGWLEPHIKQITNDYYLKKEEMMNSLNTYFGEEDGVSWTNPKGGMFVWMDIHPLIHVNALSEHARREGVVFVPGVAFSSEQVHRHQLRLCFAYCDKEDISLGIERLHKAMQNALSYPMSSVVNF